MHHVTRQIEYRGDVVALTEALVGFPAGGQVLLSGSTYQRVYGNLHAVQFDDRGPGPNTATETTSKEEAGECATPLLSEDHVRQDQTWKLAKELLAKRSR